MKKSEIELIDKIINFIPIKHPATEKGKLRTGFYQGAKYVNTTMRLKLEELKTNLLKENGKN